jgi:hypothetical protein
MFRSLLYDNPQGSSFVLGAFTTFRLQAAPEDGHKIMTEICRVFNDAFTKHFNKF